MNNDLSWESHLSFSQAARNNKPRTPTPRPLSKSRSRSSRPIHRRPQAGARRNHGRHPAAPRETLLRGIKSNWPLADYELGEIQEGLEDAIKFNPTFKGTPVASLVPALTKGSLQKVHDAIDKKDKKSFLEAYNSLSTSCSNCHKAANHPFVQIQTPTEAQFSDQKFTP